jgi:hypothetical protein
MKVILLMLTFVLYGGTNSTFIETNRPAEMGTVEPARRKVSITFTGMVKAIEMLGERKLNVIPLDFDSRFAVIVHIESVTPRETPLKEGVEEVFAIHSPAKLFLATEEEVIGEKYRFKMTWEKMGNRSKFSQLTASRIDDDAARPK